MSLDDRHAQLRGALDEQFAAIKQEYDRAVAEARGQAAADTRREAEAARAAWDAQLQPQLAAARGEAEARAREAFTAERQRLVSDAQAREQILRAQLEQAQQQAAEAAVLATESARAHTDAQDQPDVAASLPHLAGTLRELDDTRSLTQALDALLSAAAAIAGRAALYLIDGERLHGWKAHGIPDPEYRAAETALRSQPFFARAASTGRAVRANAPAQTGAHDAADPTGIVAPVMIGGRAVAMLYAGGGDRPPLPGALATIDIIAEHASAVVALRTASRTIDVLRGMPPSGADDPGAGGEPGARRFARILMSEIKLYNEAAVRAGREGRDLLHRLGVEIDRARRLYEERVPPSVGARRVFFDQELVRTLAGGDPALLGHS